MAAWHYPVTLLPGGGMHRLHGLVDNPFCATEKIDSVKQVVKQFGKQSAPATP